MWYEPRPPKYMHMVRPGIRHMSGQWKTFCNRRVGIAGTTETEGKVTCKKCLANLLTEPQPVPQA